MGWRQALICTLSALVAAGCADADRLAPPQAGELPDTHFVVSQPPGFVSFCVRNWDQCAPHNNSLAAVPLDSAAWQLLKKVNTSVNAAITPEDDEEHYGRAEYWTIPTDGYGDCDDYAVAKRAALLNAGMPSSVLRLAIVVTPSNADHAVLTISTDHGDLVLDNLTNQILPWDKTGFRWVKRQDKADPMQWVSADPKGLAAEFDRIAAAANDAAKPRLQLSSLDAKPSVSANTP